MTRGSSIKKPQPPSIGNDIVWRRLCDLPSRPWQNKPYFSKTFDPNLPYVNEGKGKKLKRQCPFCGYFVTVPDDFSEWEEDCFNDYKMSKKHCNERHPGQIFHYERKLSYLANNSTICFSGSLCYIFCSCKVALILYTSN
jgi:hypothetical protein